MEEKKGGERIERGKRNERLRGKKKNARKKERENRRKRNGFEEGNGGRIRSRMVTRKGEKERDGYQVFVDPPSLIGVALKLLSSSLTNEPFYNLQLLHFFA